MSGKQRSPKKISWTQVDILVSTGLIILTLILYIATLAPSVLPADAGEFQFVPWLPGIPHPTGYPLYTVLGWLWTHLLPLGEVAWRMNLLSAVFAAITVGLAYDVTRQILDKALPATPQSARVLAAILAAATFAVTHTFWSQAIIAEVYALHALFVALILWLTLKASTEINLNSRQTKLLTLTFGLGLTHHSTTILLLPAVVLFLFVSYRQHPTPILSGKKLIFTHIALFITPLLLYLYLPLIAPTTPYTTISLSNSQTLTLYDNSLVGFWQHITGSVFAGELQPGAVGPARFVLAWQLLLLQVGWAGLALATVGLVTLAQRQRIDLLLLTGLAATTFIIFNLIYFIGDVFVLFIPVWLILCLWIGVGSLGLAHWLANSFVQRKSRPHEGSTTFARMEQVLAQRMYRLLLIILLSVGLLGYVVPLAIKNSPVSQRHNMFTHDRWQVIMSEPLPDDAILMSNDRNEIMPMWYYQYVDGWRPDLVGLFPLIVTDPAYANVGRVLDEALASRRPVYFVKDMDGLDLKADLMPTGTLVLAQPINMTPSYFVDVTLPEIIVENPNQTETIRLLGYDSPVEMAASQVLDVTLYWQPTQDLSIDYTSFVHLINSEGQGITQSDHQPGGNFYPSSYWQPGETLRDQHTLILPPDLPAGTYQLRVGMYHQPEPGIIRGMGNGLEIGSLIVASE
jgi:hypothetical protein